MGSKSSPLHLLALDGFSALAFAVAHAIGMEKRITQHYGRSGRPVQKPRFVPAERAHALPGLSGLLNAAAQRWELRPLVTKPARLSSLVPPPGHRRPPLPRASTVALHHAARLLSSSIWESRSLVSQLF